jgi:hypothetical protein
MSSAQRLASHRKIRLDGTFLTIAFRHGCLAGSPYAVTVADPFVCGRKDETPAATFTFADIPDFHFREPRHIIRMTNIGGAKS